MFCPASRQAHRLSGQAALARTQKPFHGSLIRQRAVRCSTSSRTEQAQCEPRSRQACSQFQRPTQDELQLVKEGDLGKRVDSIDPWPLAWPAWSGSSVTFGERKLEFR